MHQLPAGAGQPKGRAKRRPSYGAGWRVTLIAAAVLLVVIVIAATIDGLRIASRERDLEVLEANVPLREQVYPGPVLASPTVVTVPRPAGEEISPNSVFVSPTVVAVPHPTVEGFVVTVKPQETVGALRSGPGTEYATVRDLVPGEQVQLLTDPIEIGDQLWQLVRTGNGQVGWCMAHWLSPVGAGE